MNLDTAAAAEMTTEIDHDLLFGKTTPPIDDLESVIRAQKDTLRIDRETAAIYDTKFAEIKAELDAEIAEAEARWRERHSELLASCGSVGEQLDASDQALRSSLIDWSRRTGNKTFDDHLSVRINTKLEYSAEAATEWAKENAPFVLTIEKKAFEAIAKHQDLRFVNKVESYSSVIAKDLPDEQVSREQG